MTDIDRGTPPVVRDKSGSMVVTYDDGERMRDGIVQPTDPPCWLAAWAALPSGGLTDEDPSELHEFPDMVKALIWAAERVDDIMVNYQGTEFYALGKG